MKIKKSEPELSNIELKRMIEKTMIRFENWRIEVERKPNPMMVHSLKNIMSIVESLTTMADKKVEYSYKALMEHMAELMSQTAGLNMAIVHALKEDDSLDYDELKKISARLFKLINAAAELARLVQRDFGSQELQTAIEEEGFLPEPV